MPGLQHLAGVARALQLAGALKQHTDIPAREHGVAVERAVLQLGA